MWNAVSKIDSLGSMRKPVKAPRNDGEDSEDDKPKLASPTKKLKISPFSARAEHKQSLGNLMEACK